MMKIVDKKKIIVKQSLDLNIRIMNDPEKAASIIEWFLTNIETTTINISHSVSGTLFKGTTAVEGFMITDLDIHFENDEDAMAFKLRWL